MILMLHTLLGRVGLVFDPAYHAGRVVVYGVALALLALLALPTGCRPVSAEPPAATATASDADAAASAAAGAALAARGSLHDLAGRWRDQDGGERTLASTAAPVRVVAMVYASCAHTCPLLVGDMKRLEASLDAARRADVRFVIVSLDPERDTPARLREMAEGARLDTTRWTLLTGAEDDVLELAAALDVRYQRQASGEIAHANVLTVLDADGAIVHREPGVGGDLQGLRAAVARLLR